MPYATPSSRTSSTSSATVPAHVPAFHPGSFHADGLGPEAFSPLSSLPRRGPSPAPKATFHFNRDEDSSLSSSDDEDDVYAGNGPPPLRLRTHQSKAHSPSQTGKPYSPSFGGKVPFPRSNSGSPTPTRTSSPPILLSNGRPLKSSLKSSSAPNISGQRHGRTTSTPSSLSSDSLCSQPSTPKSVHFPSLSSDLESVRVFSRSAKPLAVSSPTGDETETETEGELGSTPPNKSFASSFGGRSWGSVGRRSASLSSSVAGYPFPRMPASRQPAPRIRHDLAAFTSPVPNPQADIAEGNVFLESVRLVSGADDAPSGGVTDELHLTGTIRVRNLSYEKHITVRFTLDDWMTTNEVRAHYLKSLPPSSPSKSTKPEDTFDIFTFRISLSALPSLAPSVLATKVLWLVVRYAVPGQGEWWDNNSGGDYKVGFVRSEVKSRRDTESVSADLGFTPHRPARLERSLSEGDSRASFAYGSANLYPPSQAVPGAGGYGYSYASGGPGIETDPFAASPSVFQPYSSSSISPLEHHEPSERTAVHQKEMEKQHDAVQHATEKRLRGFSLSNYARPTVKAAPAPPILSPRPTARDLRLEPLLEAGQTTLSKPSQNSIALPSSAPFSKAPTKASSPPPTTPSKASGFPSLTINTAGLPVSGLEHKAVPRVNPDQPSPLVKSVGALQHVDSHDSPELMRARLSRESSTSPADSFEPTLEGDYPLPPLSSASNSSDDESELESLTLDLHAIQKDFGGLFTVPLRSHTRKQSSATPTPTSSPVPSSPAGFVEPHLPHSFVKQHVSHTSGVASDTLYKAFVKQWCFATTPPMSPGMSEASSGTATPQLRT